MAHELAADDILPGAGKLAHAGMHHLLDAAQMNFKAQIEAKRKAVMMVDGKTVVADMKGKTKSFDEFLEDADMAMIDDADEFEEALVAARVSIAALGSVTEIQLHFDAELDKLAKSWLKKYGQAIKALSHDRQESYRQIREMSTEPQDVELVKPETKYEPTKVREKDSETALPTYKNHLLCDAEGNYPVELKSSWESKVVEAEMKRNGFKFWYRNPQQPGQSSLGIAYLSGEQCGIVRQDFIFFAVQEDGTIVTALIDPHGLHLADALPKLRGLALYAETHTKIYRRIESVAESMGKLRVLDLTNEKVQEAIATAKDAASLFAGALARDY